MTSSQVIRTLALSVHFRHPKLGMKNYEILSRASAFLLAVDPQNSTDEDKPHSARDLHDHLRKYEIEQKERQMKRDYAREPAGGPKRESSELGWLEFCPKDNRPIAHVIASSHVLAPWLWREYYPQDWITQVEQEHCAYSLDVICPTKPEKSLAKFALNPYPLHHPENMDLAIIHLKNENAALNHMMDLGVEMLHLRGLENEFTKGEQIYFEGFEVGEDTGVDTDENEITFNAKKSQKDDSQSFLPYKAEGQLFLFSPSRFLASTPDGSSPENANKPLPQGLCGGPVLDTENRVCGVVEGIVPMDHHENQLAGAAAFIPLHHLHNFVEWAEYFMLQQIVPEKLFNKIKSIKEKEEVEFGTDITSMENSVESNVSGDAPILDMNDITDNVNKKRVESKGAGSIHISAKEGKQIEKDLSMARKEIEKKFTKEQVETIFSVVEQEKQEVIDLLKTEGGDMDEIIAKVRARTLQKQMKIIQKIAKDQEETVIAEEVDSTDGNKNN